MKAPSVIFKHWPHLPKIVVDDSQTRKILSFTVFLLILVLALLCSTLA
jgi:hypothetical protein